MTDDRLPGIALAAMLLLIVAALLGLCLAPPETAAQREPDALLLARVWASEIGWDASPEEVAVWQVLVRRSHIGRMSRTLRQTMRAYSPRATGRRRVPVTAREAWVQGLALDGTRPPAWGRASGSRGVAWASYRPRWLALLERARARLAGTDGRESPCVEPPDFWASRRHPRDRAIAARAIRAGRWERVDCGPTANAFYRRAPR